MKRTNTILLITFFVINIFPQGKYEIKQSVKDFFDLASKKVIKEGRLTKYAAEPSEEEIKNITRSYYNAIAEDPVGFEAEMKKEFKEYNDLYFKGGKLGIKPGVKIRIMKETMSKKYGKNFVKIIGVPYYLKIKINSIDQEKFHSYVDPRLEGRQVNLRCTVEEVIKGKNKFSKGDSITISYLIDWSANYIQKIEIGKEYFAAIRIWGVHNPFSPQYTFRYVSDSNVGVYPVENGFIKLPEDYFINKLEMDWNQFKEYFQDKFMDIN